MPRVPNQSKKPLKATTCIQAANTDLKFKLMATNLKKQLEQETPFTENYQVNETIGQFNVGDSVQGLTTKQIFSKLLNLSIGSETPPVINPPIVENIVVDAIKAEELSVSIIDETGELRTVPYQQITIPQEEAIKLPEQSGFYQIINAKHEPIEVGYQLLTLNNPDGPFMIILPSILDANVDIRIQIFNSLAAAGEDPWVDYTQLNLTNNYSQIKALCEEVGWKVPQVERGYTLWADLSQPSSGATFRFIIV